MAHPLLATGRISLTLTVTGKVHKVRAFVDVTGMLLGNITRRGVPLVMPAANAAQALWDTIRPMYNNTVGPPVASLDLYSGGIWTTALYFVLINNGGRADPTSPAAQMTYTFRAEDLSKVKLVILEPGYASPYHYDLTTLVPPFTVLAAEFGAGHVAAEAPYVWMKSRDNQYLADVPFVALTGSLNRKARRARNLA